MATKYAVGLILVIASISAYAGSLSGTVKDEAGAPQAGVMVRVTEDKPHGDSQMVYTDAKGRFQLNSNLNGAMKVRLRLAYEKDLEDSITLTPVASLTRGYTMKKMTEPQAISDSLPAAYHFGHLPFETVDGSPFTKYQFQRDCLTCHQLGNALTRVPRSPQSWATTIQRMHAYLGNFDVGLRDRRAQILSAGFDGKPLSVRPMFPIDPKIFSAKIYEYPFVKAYSPHDAAVSPSDGMVYTVDQGVDLISVTNLATGTTQYIPHPAQGVKPHTGAEMGSGVLHGPHSLALGPDGKWYTTNSFSERIGIFNPKTMQWEESIPIGGRGVYPHTIRFDQKGIAWFTLAQSEQVGRLDPQTRDVKLINLPQLKSKGIAGVTVPYGIDVSPEDGTVWYTRLFGDKIGRINPATLQLKEYDSPVRGPRRMRFDKKGTLWLTGFSDGILARIQPNPFEASVGFNAELYRMPQFAPGYQPAPYAVGISPTTQEVWINENLTDRIFKFIPKEKRFVVYPMPLRGTYTRDFSFTKDGKACTSNDPVPPAALEGGVQELICIAP
ncbi:MAG: carboxypeptidase regulatory-like domain-containing protein [Steroidobacteraceae bacterium]